MKSARETTKSVPIARSFRCNFWAHFGDLHNAKNLMMKMLCPTNEKKRIRVSFVALVRPVKSLEIIYFCWVAREVKEEGKLSGPAAVPCTTLKSHSDRKKNRLNFPRRRRWEENPISTHFHSTIIKHPRLVIRSFMCRRHHFMFGTGENFRNKLVFVHTRS